METTRNDIELKNNQSIFFKDNIKKQYKVLKEL